MPSELLGEKITAINKDSANNLYIGTSNGLFVNKVNSKPKFFASSS